MKKTILLLSCIFSLSATQAAITIVNVANNQFNPVNPTVNVGDTIRYNFISGFHDAISTGSVIPVGAALIFSGAPSSTPRIYDYKVTVAGTYNYYCSIHGNSSGSGMAASFVATNPLPLRMGTFSASMAQNKSVSILWNTYNEVNINRFVLRRSTDGVHFTDLATLNAQGSEAATYNYSDVAVAETRYVFYQLAIYEDNGSITFSNTTTLKNTFENGKLILKMGPNPLTRPEQLMIQFNAENEGLMEVTVYNTGGKNVLYTKMQAFPGFNNGHLHLCDLNAGVYKLKFSFEGKEETKSVIVY